MSSSGVAGTVVHPLTVGSDTQSSHKVTILEATYPEATAAVCLHAHLRSSTFIPCSRLSQLLCGAMTRGEKRWPPTRVTAKRRRSWCVAPLDTPVPCTDILTETLLEAVEAAIGALEECARGCIASRLAARGPQEHTPEGQLGPLLCPDSMQRVQRKNGNDNFRR